jgi:hypothetical protein
MTTRSAAVLSAWDARRARTGRERAFLVYLAVICLLAVVAPLARALWVTVTSTASVAALTSPAASLVAGLLAGALWAVALFLGGHRGPALLPPFLTFTLVGSDLPRWGVFRRPLVRACLCLALATTLAATICVGSLFNHGLVAVSGVILFSAAGLLVGLIAFVLWLAGQVFPRMATVAGLTIVALGALGIAVPGLRVALPWGWVGLAYRAPGAAAGFLALAPLLALTVALLACVPIMLERIRLDDAAAQSARWDATVSHALSLDLNAASSLYQARPRVGRRFRAVRPSGRLFWVFPLRDAVGAARTPGRFLAGAAALAGSGILMSLALSPPPWGPSWAPLFGGLSGLLMFAGMGPITDGIRHAAQVASDLPIYGVGDRYLVLAHSVMPLAVSLLISVSSAVVLQGTMQGIVSGPVVNTGTVIGAGVATVILGVLVLGTRISNAFKGPMPLLLLTPLPSPLGDPMPVFRLAWALDGLLLAAMTGLCARFMGTSVIPLVLDAAVIVAAGLMRWRHR